ncbi:MAG: VOC family protein [Sporichthyaceae bacterium]
MPDPVFAPGVPCWVDVTARDPAATARFYSALFGWSAEPGAGPGGAPAFLAGEHAVAGVGPCPDAMVPAWNLYFASADVEALTATVRAAGGQLLAGPVEVGTAGRAAAFSDPQGAGFTVWQAGDFSGMARTHVPGSWCWSELITTAVIGAADFYGAIFGWQVGAEPGGATPGAVAVLGDRAVAGMVQMPADAGVLPYWSVTFQVADVAATAARAQSLGAAVLVPPANVPDVGTFALLRPPGGETLSILAPAAG